MTKKKRVDRKVYAFFELVLCELIVHDLDYFTAA